MKKEKILVTGGAGYLGSILVPELLKAGYVVTVLDNFMYNQSSLMEVCANDDFSVARGDVRDKNKVADLIKDKDYIIPLAAIVGAPSCDMDKTAARTINFEAIRDMAKMCSKNQRIIYPTTNSGYGIGQEGIECTEETSLNPISLYGKVKSDAEKAVLDRGNAICFRLATVFGVSPRMRIDLLVNDFTYRAVRDKFIVIFEGNFKRNYIHIRDVAGAFLHSIANFDTMKNEVYNVGLSDANISKIELCKRIKSYVKGFVFLESEIGEDPDKRNYIVSNSKIETTGYKPCHSLDMGIEELLKCYTIIINWKYGNVC